MALAPQSRLTDEERTNLVAFLDGEADHDVTQRLEEKRARSVSVRKEMEALEKTWQMLDWLPRPEAPADFANQTITQIHSRHLQAELMAGRLKIAAVIAARALGWVASFALLAALGFISVRYLWPDPARQFIEDLDCAEHLETYQAIPDLKFLDDLSRLGIFIEPTGGTDSRPTGETPSEQ